jgi:hypothetical protein
MAELSVLVAYTQNGGDDPATGLALADIDLYLTAVNRVTGVDTVLWDGTQNPTFEVDNCGVYGRIYADGDLDTYNYVGGGDYTGAVALDNDWVVGVTGLSELEGLAEDVVAALMAVSPIAHVIRSTDLQLYRGDTWTQPIARLGDISGRDKLWITCKGDKDDADSQAIFMIEETAGLVYIVGTAASVPANGSITVTDAAIGNITVVLAAAETAKIEATKQFFYDVQILEGTVVTTLRAGYLMVTSDVTKVVA